MRLAAALGTSLAKLLDQEVRAGERAVTRGVRSETDRLKRDLREPYWEGRETRIA